MQQPHPSKTDSQRRTAIARFDIEYPAPFAPPVTLPWSCSTCGVHGAVTLSAMAAALLDGAAPLIAAGAMTGISSRFPVLSEEDCLALESAHHQKFPLCRATPQIDCAPRVAR